jgi:methane/ammonia monooxygenase subunit A
MAAGAEARPGPALETAEEQRKAFRQLDIILAILLFFLFMGLYHIVAMLTIGDWDFWVDWKDRRWWILLTPVVLISMPAAVQYIFWAKFRLPFAATLLTFCLVVAEWLNRFVNMHGWAYFPLDFIWPATLIPSGIALDVVLLLTGSYVMTAIFGGALWSILFYPTNWVMLARYMVPTNMHGFLMSLADVMGYQFVRTGTPEYLRIIDRGTLRSFGQDPIYISLAFSMFACMLVYMVFMGVGYLFTRTQFSWFKRV